MKQDFELCVCRGCLRRWPDFPYSKAEEFLLQVEREVEEKTERRCHVKTASCLRLCPEGKIAITVDRQLSMSRTSSLESVVSEVSSLLRDQEKKK